MIDVFCKCCFAKNAQDIKFKNKWLRMKKAVDPELILWENYAVSRRSKCARKVVFVFGMIALLLCCFEIVFTFEKTMYNLEK